MVQSIRALAIFKTLAVFWKINNSKETLATYQSNTILSNITQALASQNELRNTLTEEAKFVFDFLADFLCQITRYVAQPNLPHPSGGDT